MKPFLRLTAKEEKLPGAYAAIVRQVISARDVFPQDQDIRTAGPNSPTLSIEKCRIMVNAWPDGFSSIQQSDLNGHSEFSYIYPFPEVQP